MAKITKPQRSKRHKKIKDADKYNQKKQILLKPVDDHVNRAPKHVDEQEIPRSVLQLMKYKENPSLMKKKRRKNRNRSNPSYDGLMQIKEKGMTVPLKPIPDFRQKKNESEKRFMHRVEMETQAVLQRSQFERKYKLDLDKVSTKDGRIDKKLISKKKRKNDRRLQEKKEKKREKLKEQKEEKKNKTGFEHLKDKVEFGEVALEPPSLLSKPRKSSSEGPSRKPGKKSLLLKEIIAKNSQASPSERQIGQSVKRKNQSLAEQRILDAEREKAIDMYRKMKAEKAKT